MSKDIRRFFPSSASSSSASASHHRDSNTNNGSGSRPRLPMSPQRQHQPYHPYRRPDSDDHRHREGNDNRDDRGRESSSGYRERNDRGRDSSSGYRERNDRNDSKERGRGQDRAGQLLHMVDDIERRWNPNPGRSEQQPYDGSRRQQQQQQQPVEETIVFSSIESLQHHHDRQRPVSESTSPQRPPAALLLRRNSSHEAEEEVDEDKTEDPIDEYDTDNDKEMEAAMAELDEEAILAALAEEDKRERETRRLERMPSYHELELEKGTTTRIYNHSASPAYQDVWDTNHVKLPCSAKNCYRLPDSPNIYPKWDLINLTLRSNISNSTQLEDAILKYNDAYVGKWDFSGLHGFFAEVADAAETEKFFTKTLPGMQKLCLRLPELFPQPIPLFRMSQPGTLFISQLQAACLLANAFFCTYPRRNERGKSAEYEGFPNINFNRLFVGTGGRCAPVLVAKYRCLFAYFHRIVSEPPNGVISFERRCLQSSPVWEASPKPLKPIRLDLNGTIEDHGVNMSQVDFANKFIGGGVIGWGAVQEEIRFLVCPELIVSRVFMEAMDVHECIIIIGAERYSRYVGYSDTFQWESDFYDTTPRDEENRRKTEVVAIDAERFSRRWEQFRIPTLERELNKAAVGFADPAASTGTSRPVATGNWGCGAFNGNLQLKALIQWMAASEVDRELTYFTYHEEEFHLFFQQFLDDVGRFSFSTGNLYQSVLSYCRQLGVRGFNQDLFTFCAQYLKTHHVNIEPQQEQHA